ncbi:adenylate kinase [Nannochloropsis oceanica]
MVTLLGFHGGTGLLSLLLLVVLQPHQSWALGASAATGYDATSAGSGSGRQGLGHAGMAWIPGLKVSSLNRIRKVAPPSFSYPSSRLGGIRMTVAARAATPKIIIAGAPASGKGTQCELLKETYGVVHLSTGDILRAAVQEGTELGTKAKDFMDRGELVPDEVIIGVVKERLAAPDCEEKGWLLDGFPRTKTQADALKTLGVAPSAFVLLNVPDEMLVERVVGRRTDPETGKIYHLKYSPPPPDVPMERLVHRSDDTEEKVKVRVKAFHEHCEAVSGCYKDVLVQVDGTQKKEAVFAAIKGAIDAALIKEKEVMAQEAISTAAMVKGKKANVPPLRIIIAGAPASGKGTQCEMLKERYGVVHLSTGDILRAAVKEGTALGKEAKGFMDRGELVPDETICGVVLDRLKERDCLEKGWLLDGFPRTKTQAEALGVIPDAFLLLNVPDEMLVERVVGRRTDPETGKIYHLKYSPPPPDVPKERLVHRSDDTEEKVKVRVKAFHEHVKSVVGVYTDVLIEVDGTQKKDAVLASITQGLDKALAKRKSISSSSKIVVKTLQTTLSLAAFIGLDAALRQLFKARAITFPSSLAGMLGLLSLLLASAPKAGSITNPLLYRALKPGTDLLTKWLAVFFVPALVLLPLSAGALAPSLALRLAAVMVLGFETSLLFTAKLAGLLTSANDKAVYTSSTATTPVIKPLAFSSSSSPFNLTLQKSLAVATLISGATSVILSTRMPSTSSSILPSLARTLFTLLATLLSYVTGSRFPSKLRKAVHPLISCAGLTLALLSLHARLLSQSLTTQLQAYVSRSSCPAHLGGGDILLGLLSPSILAMAVQVYERRALLTRNLGKIMGTCLGASAFGLFSSAALSRAFSLPPALGKATLSRCITTPLAMAVAGLVGADAGIAVLVVVLTGLLGANAGAARLASYGVSDPVSKGLAMGAAAHGIGTASLAEEPEPLAFAAMAMALTGVMTTVLVTVPPVRAALLMVLMGGAKAATVLP